MYADDTQVYISFKLKTPHEAVDTINECIFDLRTWMINYKLKINDSKTEFLIIRSQFFKVMLPKLTGTVGDTEISSSDKARNLGVIFDSLMNFEPHITQVCRVAYMHLSNVRNRHDISPVFTGIPFFLSWPRSFLWKSQNRFKNLGNFYGGGGGGYIC